jgi:hypothetical protein
MKRLFTLFIFFTAVHFASAADSRFPDYREFRMATPSDLMQIVNGQASIISTAEINPAAGQQQYFKPTNDTLKEYLTRATDLRIYGININGNQFPLVGTNPIYYYVGQKFTYPILSNYSYKLTGVLIPLAINVLGGSYYDTSSVMVLPTDVQGLPQGNPFALGKLFLNNADSNSTKPLYNYLLFDSTGVVTENFTIYVQTRNLVDAESDFMAVWANNQGDGKSESRSTLILYNNGWMIANFSDLNIDMGGGLRPDFDVLLLPVIEKEMTASVDEPLTIHGITLNGIYPNPIKENASIKISTDVGSELSVDIIDLGGRVVKSIYNSRIESGDIQIDFNTQEISAGTYLISFKSGNNGFAVKTTIVK